MVCPTISHQPTHSHQYPYGYTDVDTHKDTDAYANSYQDANIHTGHAIPACHSERDDWHQHTNADIYADQHTDAYPDTNAHADPNPNTNAQYFACTDADVDSHPIC